MDELTVALEMAFTMIGDNLGLFVGLPAVFITGWTAVELVKIMCGITYRRRSVVVADRQQYIRGEKKYVPPVLDVVKCPVSDDCKKCRFFNTDRCIKGYL